MKKDECGEVLIYQGDKGAIITFVDENEYKKLERALRKYCMKSYKVLIFDIFPSLRDKKLKDGDYEYELLTDKSFEKVYGKIKLKFYVHGNIIVIKNLEPYEMLMAMHSVELPTYKGVPYRDKKDLFKIRFFTGGYDGKY